MIQHLARRFRHVAQHGAGNRIHRGVFHRIEAVGQHNPRPVMGGQLARVLEGCFCLALQVRRDHNGFQAVFKAHDCLLAAATGTYVFEFECALQRCGGSDTIHPPL